jgi:hypothetical protein
MSVVLYHFSSKDEFVPAIVSESFVTVIDAMVPPAEAETTAAGKLRACIRAQSAYIDTHRREFMAILDLETILRTGQDNGEFRTFDTARVAVAQLTAIGVRVREAGHEVA